MGVVIQFPSRVRAICEMTKTELANEIEGMRAEIRKWNDLYPYEKTYVINRLKEIVVYHSETLGETLTTSTLYLIRLLDTLR